MKRCKRKDAYVLIELIFIMSVLSMILYCFSIFLENSLVMRKSFKRRDRFRNEMCMIMDDEIEAIEDAKSGDYFKFKEYERENLNVKRDVTLIDSKNNVVRIDITVDNGMIKKKMSTYALVGEN